MWKPKQCVQIFKNFHPSVMCMALEQCMSDAARTLVVCVRVPHLEVIGLNAIAYSCITCLKLVNLMENCFFMHKQSLPQKTKCTQKPH